MAELEPDPHGYVRQGTEMAQKYMGRQYWSMKWVTLVLAGLMTTVTITAGMWLIPMNIMTWAMAMGMWWMGNGTLRALFITGLRKQRAGKQSEMTNIFHSIGYTAWGMYFLQVVIVHWIMMIGWFSFFAEIPKG